MIDSAERRNNARTRFVCFARCRRPEVGPEDSEWLCVTKDFSHDGVHFQFLAGDHDLSENSQLLLRFPYNDNSRVKDREYLVEVMRINSLLQGRCEIGARLVVRVPLKLQSGLFVPEAVVREYALPEAAAHIDVYI